MDDCCQNRNPQDYTPEIHLHRVRTAKHFSSNLAADKTHNQIHEAISGLLSSEGQVPAPLMEHLTEEFDLLIWMDSWACRARAQVEVGLVLSIRKIVDSENFIALILLSANRLSLQLEREEVKSFSCQV